MMCGRTDFTAESLSIGVALPGLAERPGSRRAADASTVVFRFEAGVLFHFRQSYMVRA
jgi:hypothetical protein